MTRRTGFTMIEMAVALVVVSLLVLIGSVVCIPFMLVSTTACLGLALTLWRRETLLLLILIAGYITPHLFILGEDRFHLAMVPFMAILAAFAWGGGWKALRERWQTRTGKIVILLAGLAILLLCLNWTTELLRDSNKIAQLLSATGNLSGFSY